VSTGIGMTLLYWALASGAMSIVAPITAVTTAVVPVALGLGMGERPSYLALVGGVMAFVAIAFVSCSNDDPATSRIETPRAVRLGAFGAGIALGVTLFLLSRPSDHAGLWPLLGARTAAVTFLAIVWVAAWDHDLLANPCKRFGDLKTHQRSRSFLHLSIFQRASTRFDMPTLVQTMPLAALASVLDVGGNILFVFAAHQGMIALVAVLISLYPASTVLLAQLVLQERIRLIQYIGLGAAAIAVTLIALG